MNSAEADAASVRPRIRDDLVVGPALLRGDKYVHVIKDPVSGQLMTVGEREHFIVSRLDGEHSLADISAKYRTRFGRVLDDRAWGSIMATLAGRSLLAGMNPEQRAASTNASEPNTLLHARLPLFRPDRWLGRLADRMSWAFTPVFTVTAMIVVIATLAVIAQNLPVLARSALELWERPWLGVLALVILWGVVAMHEVGHGLAAKHFGARVGEIGIRWRFPLVAPYCSVEEIQLLPGRHRVRIAFAGVFVSLLALPPMVLLRWGAPEGGTVHTLTSGLVLFGTVTALVNFVPFLRLDGYAMVNHALGTENLARDSTSYVVAWSKSLVRRAAPAPRPPRWARNAYLVYALLATVFHTTLAILVAGWWFALLEHLYGAWAAVSILLVTAVLITAVYRIVAVRQRRRASNTPGVHHEKHRTRRRFTDKERK